jgi:cytidylate kinase
VGAAAYLSSVGFEMRSSYSAETKSGESTLDLQGLLDDLVTGGCRFVVIGSSALAVQGWKIAPGDLDVMAPEGEIGKIQTAIGVMPAQTLEVDDGEARRIECMVNKGPVDIYLEVSGGLTYEEISRHAMTVAFGKKRLAVPVAMIEHVRDMRAAVGRTLVPEAAVEPGDRPGAPKVVAIDGPAGAGKSTVSRKVAKELDFTYLNTGAMYRCVALAVLGREADLDDHESIAAIAESAKIEFRCEQVFLDARDVSEAIRDEEVTTITAHLSAFPEVRRALVQRQRELFAAGGYVAEGRDTGTVVAPEAPLKIYLTASLDERALRRAVETGEPIESVKKSLENRDQLDEGRKMSALRVAEDAVVVDTTGRSVHDVVDEIATRARERGIV